jgi:hypothetical protein
MRPPFGTIAWVRATGGRLSATERLRELARGLASRFAGSGPRSAIDLDTVRAPDTTTALAAEALCRAVSPGWLVNHGLRAYLWARLLATQDFDDELLYVACVLHDLGLVDRFARRDGTCFTLASGDAAVAFAAEHGWEPARREALANAIALHLNVRVALGDGVEAHLVHEGVALDVIGNRARALTPAQRDAVVARHPRDGFKQQFVAGYRDIAAATPGCRPGLHLRWMMFARYVAKAPFADQLGPSSAISDT